MTNVPPSGAERFCVDLRVGSISTRRLVRQGETSERRSREIKGEIMRGLAKNIYIGTERKRDRQNPGVHGIMMSGLISTVGALFLSLSLCFCLFISRIGYVVRVLFDEGIFNALGLSPHSSLGDFIQESTPYISTRRPIQTQVPAFVDT